MKKIDTRYMILACLFILTAFMIPSGCGGNKGELGGGHWYSSAIPSVSSTDPANGATNVSLGNKITATFSEAMDPASINATTFTLRQGSTPVPGTVTYFGVSGIFTPTGTLAAGTVYTATITTGARDPDGNALPTNYIWSFTTGVAPDTTRPTVTLTVPPNGATGVVTNTKISATFSEAMDPASISTTTFTLRQGGTPVMGSVAYTGVTAVFTPASTLAYNTIYTATITTGARDLGGNTLATEYVWSFTTGAAPDTIRPAVIFTVPANGATGVLTNTKISATFSEAMDPLTITTATFTLKQGSTVVAGSVTYTGVTAVFAPTAALAVGTTYTGTITTGARDLAGNALASDYVWSFTTGAAADTTRPVVTFTVPANGASGVETNTQIAATFSKSMDPLTITTGTFIVQQGATIISGTVNYSGVTAVFIPTSTLAVGVTYSATITTLARDLAGNSLASDYFWMFTTGAAPDTTKPTVTLTDPVNVATNVSVNSTVKATFSEPMDQFSIPTNFTLMNGLVAVPGIVTYDLPTRTATFAPTTALLPNTTYTATVANGARDLAGNTLDVPALGLPSNPWTFRTAAAVVPPGALTLSSFGIASAGGITNSGATKINGNVVLNPNQTCNAVVVDNAGGFGLCGGFAPTKNAGDVVITQTYPDTTTADSVRAELLAKWISLSPALLPGATVLGCGTIGSAGGAGALIGCSGNPILPPGTYKSASNTTIDIAGDLTLNGTATDVWVIQVPSALTTGVSSRILLTGGAKASNVWWYVGSSATINGSTIFQGNILASASISMGTGATSCGRLLAGAEGAGTFTFLANTVSVPGHANAPPGCQ